MQRMYFFLLIFITNSAVVFSQKKMEVGQVSYEVKTEDVIDYSTSIDIHFSELGDLYTLSTQNDIVKLNYFWKNNNEENYIFLLHIGNNLFHITDIPEEKKYDGTVFLDANNIEKIKYRKGKKKKILDYKCSRADIVMKDGEEWTFYLTDKIKTFAASKNTNLELKGFPLEAYHKKSKTTFQAKNIYKKTDMELTTDMKYYTKMTYEELANFK